MYNLANEFELLRKVSEIAIVFENFLWRFRTFISSLTFCQGIAAFTQA
jgi:hypothetical protein